MASFDNLALQYVVLEDEAVMLGLAAQAAKAIEDAGASRVAVGNWAASIKLWIAPGLDNRGADPGREDGESGNAITRSKAIGFLAATLEVLNKDLLKADQVDLLIGFFGSMFSNDHKAGITPAAAALKQLATAKNFKPQMGVKIVEDISKMKEDFRLQTAATRLEVYHLLLRLVEDPAIAGELQHKYGASGGFILDLLALCQHERDPKNLMVWFEIIKTLVAEYSPSDEVTDEAFKAFSNYFPITLRESTTPIGVTPEDLKGALRKCFSAHHRLARLTFPYLIQRLDQGDSMKVTVKNDILMTMKACIENYDNTHTGLMPFIPSIWNSLKYEVRNGEVAESVQGAISVLRAVAGKLQDDPPQLNEYIHMVFRDSLDDLSEQDYVKQAGQICLAVISSSAQAFVSHSPKLVDSVIQKIPQFSSATYATYTRDLLDILEAILKARQILVQLHPDHDELLAAKSATHFQNLFHKVFLPLWQNYAAYNEGPELGVLQAITSGVAMLVSQEIVLADGKRSLLCSSATCKEICSLFAHRLLMPLTLSPRDAAAMVGDVDIGLQEALSTVVTHYLDGFQMLVAATTDAIQDRDWKSTGKRSIDHLWQVICRVSFTGCSQLPHEIGLASAKKKYAPLHHFMTWSGALLLLIESFLAEGADGDPRVVKLMVAGLHHSMRCLQDACGSETQQVNLHPGGEETLDWASEMKKVTAGAEIPSEWLRLLHRHHPDIHDQVWPNTVEDAQSIPPSAETKATGSSRQDVFPDFIRLSLFIVRHLFRRVTKVGHDPNGKTVRLADELGAYSEKRRRAILEQIEKMAPMIIKTLDARSQHFYELPNEAFRLFRNCNIAAPYWSVEEDGALNFLTLSILHGLWPDAMTDLYERDGIAQTLLCNHAFTWSGSLSRSQAWIVALIANKYKASASAFDFKEVSQFWQSRLEQNMASYDTKIEEEVGIDIERVLSILVGAVPRQEKAVLPLIPLTHKVIGLPRMGDHLAGEIEAVFEENMYLQTETHAVIKPLYKQWAYAHLVKPMYALATSATSGTALSSEELGSSAEESYDSEKLKPVEHYTTAIMSILTHCPFAIYESDIDPLVSMILTVLRELIDIYHIEAALLLLQKIMRNDAAALKHHLRAIITALKEEYRANLEADGGPKEPGTDWQALYVENLGAPVEPCDRRYQSTNSPRPDFGVHTQTSRPDPCGVNQRTRETVLACRKMVLEMVGEMPKRFEERYVMPFKGDMNQFLDSCCGDPVRELRRVAVEAREAWFALV